MMETNDLARFENCACSISIGQTRIEIRCVLTCRRDGTIRLDCERLPIDQSTFQLSALNQGGRTLPWFTIEGETGDGQFKIITSTAILADCDSLSTPDGSWITPHFSAAELLLTRKCPKLLDQEHRVEFLAAGLQGLVPISGGSSVGTVSVAGSSQVEDFDLMTGTVSITSEQKPSNVDEWVSRCEDQAKAVLDILSLAEGRLIRWSVRRLSCGKEVISILLVGPRRSTRPMYPLFWYMNLQPTLDLALKGYTQDLRERTGINVAIEWSLMHTRHLETELLCGMTALEHLVSRFRDEERGGNLPKAVFKTKVRPFLNSALTTAEAAVGQIPGFDAKGISDAFLAITRKLGDLNRRPLEENSRRMLTFYQVPMDGIENGLEVIGVRNDIVHRGIFARDSETDQKLLYWVALLRELLHRVFMAMLDYEGPYQSFLNGPETRAFRRASLRLE